MQAEQIPVDLLSDEELYVGASTGKRLANYLIDVFIFYLLIIVVTVVVALIFPGAAGFFNEDNIGGTLGDRIITLILYAIYMSIVETIFKGRSIGKFITRTKAINLDGSELTTATAFKRGFSRAVPFCVFSAFGNPCNPWQDRWTNTMVVDKQTRL
jgi:uncharacterized RDD family membrane protein YckC